MLILCIRNMNMIQVQHEREVISRMEERQYTLKELRARKDETQEQTAKALGISTQTYNAWEKDISGVAISKVLALANYFDVRLSEIKVG